MTRDLIEPEGTNAASADSTASADSQDAGSME